MISRQNCSLGEELRAQCENRDRYFEQSAATRNGHVPRLSPWRWATPFAIESNQGEISNDEHARHS